jgi:hypothetical protein
VRFELTKGCPLTGVQSRCIQPLCQLSIVGYVFRRTSLSAESLRILSRLLLPGRYCYRAGMPRSYCLLGSGLHGVKAVICVYFFCLICGHRLPCCKFPLSHPIETRTAPSEAQKAVKRLCLECFRQVAICTHSIRLSALLVELVGIEPTS